MKRCLRWLGLPAACVAASGCHRQAETPQVLLPVPGAAFVDIAPRWSPDGTRIAFLRSTPRGYQQLCEADARLTRVAPVLMPEAVSPDRPFCSGVTGYRAPQRPAWAPGSQAVVYPRIEWFTSDPAHVIPGNGLWSCDLRDRGVVPLAIHPSRYAGPLYYYRSPQWSPDGRRVAWIGETSDGAGYLYIRPLGSVSASGVVPRYDAYGDVDWPAWSPDGRCLAFRQGLLRAPTADGEETVRVLSPGGTEARCVFRVRASTYRPLLRDESDADTPATPKVSGISWAPDGSRLAFAVSRSAGDTAHCALYVASTAFGATATLVKGSGGLLAPVWLDSHSLGALKPRGASFDVVRIPATGGAPIKLAGVPTDDVDWSPDRRVVVYATSAPARSGTTLRLLRLPATRGR